MKAYSIDLRRVILACDAGGSTGIVAKRFDVSPAWVRRLKQHRRERGTSFHAQSTGHAGARSIRLTELVRQQPDATLVELRERPGVTVAKRSIGRASRRLKI